jgi:tumor protein p53-inducible protein 3
MPAGLPSTMDAIVPLHGKCALERIPVPEPGLGQVLVRVMATAVNRADTLQRKGKYPPPSGVTKVLGLELAGEVVKLGPNVSGREYGSVANANLTVGSRVMALVSGGGYADFAVVDEGCLIPIPANMPYTQAAAIPEVHLTAYQLIHFVAQAPIPATRGGFKPLNKTILIHAGGSGVGIAAIQLAKAAGFKVLVTAGTDKKLANAMRLGANAAYNYKSPGGFSSSVLAFTEGKGVDLILDCVGGSHAAQNAQVLGMDSKWVVYGLMGGADPALPNLFALLMKKRASIVTSTLRTRSLEYKAALVKSFIHSSIDYDRLPSALHAGSASLDAVIDRTYDTLRDAQAAHEYMESNANNGKIVLRVGDRPKNNELR